MLAKQLKYSGNLLGMALLLADTPAKAEKVEIATATGKALAVIVEPISVRAERNLNFGYLQSGKCATKAVIPQEALQNGSSSAAKFEVRGAPLKNYRIHIDPSVFARDEETGFEISVVNLKSYSLFLNNIGQNGRLNEKGLDNVFFGGTIFIDENVPSDIYKADFLVSVHHE